MNIVVRLMSLGLLLAGFVSTATAASLATQCGTVFRNTVKTTTNTFTFNSLTFVAVPNAAFLVTVPSGKQQCVTVTFSASASCPLGCSIKALDNAAELEPSGVNNQFAEGNSSEVHSFQWVKRLAAGSHTIRIQVAVGSNIANATLGPYTSTLEVAN